MSRPEPEIRATDRGMMRPEPFLVHAPRFQLALAPSKRVEGVARDKDSGRPIAGLEIKAAVFDESSLIWAPGIEAKTDAEGRYRLDGLPKAAAYRLFLTPGPGLPYTKATLKAPADSPVLESVSFDFALKSGIIVRGRVTDKATGRPVRGDASYYAFADNSHVGHYPGFLDGLRSYAYFNEDGSYELTALPGRGLIAIRAEYSRHREVVGAEKIKGFDPEYRRFNTLPNMCDVGGHHAIAEVNLDPKSGPITVDFLPDPGHSVAVEVVDPDGRPLGGTSRSRASPSCSSRAPIPRSRPASKFNALDPARPRRDRRDSRGTQVDRLGAA